MNGELYPGEFEAMEHNGRMDALEQEPCPNVISRSDMLDVVGHGTTYTSEELQKIIKGLPPVSPQANTGYWKRTTNAVGDNICVCSCCGKIIQQGYLNFCGNCGVKMEIPTGSESEG